MRTVSIKLKDMAIANIQLGFVGENNATQIVFDCESVFTDYPEATQTLVVTPPEGDTYQALTARVGNDVVWIVSSDDVEYAGNGSVHLKFTENGSIIKSYNADTTVMESGSSGGGGGGGGGGGTTDYNDLDNKPQINGVTLSGNKTLSSLGVHNVPAGGTTNQVLAKNSNTDHDLKWVDQSGGGGGAEIDDTAGHGDTTVVWSAGKTYDEIDALSGEIGDVEDAVEDLNDAVGLGGASTTFGTGNPVTVNSIGAVVRVESDAAQYLITGKNLFSAGDQTVSVFKSVALPCKFPAGSYSISCVATSTDTDSDVCTINLFNGSTAAATGKSIYRNTRQGATFTATTEFDNIYFYASNNFAHATGDTATFTDILFEAGEDKTAFEEYRGEIKNISERSTLEHSTEIFYSTDLHNVTVKTGEVSPESIEGRLQSVIQKVQYPYPALYGKKIVNFGDSIFANGVENGDDISSCLAAKTGATVINCAFGGCRMGNHSLSQFDAFGMHSLADAISTGTWTTQDTALSGQDIPSYFATTLATLKTVDFSKVDLVTISYGTNDFAGGLRNGGSDNNSTDYALKYSVEKLLTAYPNLHIIVCVPMYRVWLNGTTFDEDSNTKQVTSSITGGGTNKLTDFVKAEQDACKEMQIPCIDTYYDLGINQWNWSEYFPSTDGTHHNVTGRNLIASYLAAKLW